MSRLLTTAVQLLLVIGAFACIRLMWNDLKQDVIDTIKDLKG